MSGSIMPAYKPIHNSINEKHVDLGTIDDNNGGQQFTEPFMWQTNVLVQQPENPDIYLSVIHKWQHNQQ